MPRRRVFLRGLRAVFVATLVIASASLLAHHEPLAKFDDKKPITLTGKVTGWIEAAAVTASSWS